MPERPSRDRSNERREARVRPERRPATAGRRSGVSVHAGVTSRGRQTRERILRAASHLFATRGFDGTSVQDVLRASGTGKSQFYHYFETKADLAVAVLRRERAQQIRALQPAFGALDGWERIGAWLDEILRAAEREIRGAGSEASALTETGLVHAALRRELVRTATLRFRLLHRGLRRMQHRGELRPGADPERLARFVAATIEGGLLLARIEGSAEPLRHALGEAFARLRSHGVEAERGLDGPKAPSP